MTKLTITILMIIAMGLAAISCGGGGSPVGIGGDEEIGITSRPAPGRSNLSGQLTSTGGLKSFSQSGGGLQGAIITLINTLTGGVTGVDITDGLGKFEFEGVPSGDSYLVKIEFTSTEDLDGDGRPDEIELYLPVSLGDQATVELLQQVGVSDSDGDGQLDAVEFEVEIKDDDGNSDQHHSQHNRRDGETRIDDDGDGEFEDEEAIDDSDADGLADANSPEDSSDSNRGSVNELEVKGVIEAINGSLITVGGVTFMLNEFTMWRIDDNRNADPAEFTVGTFVEVEGLPDGLGGWVATKVKTEDEDHDGSNDDDSSDDGEADENEVKGTIEAISETSITVAGVTFILNEFTTWRMGDNRNADHAGFVVGMFVEVEGNRDGQGGWIAKKVKTEDNDGDGSDGDDDSSDDSDDSGDDDSNDDDGNDSDSSDDDEDDTDDKDDLDDDDVDDDTDDDDQEDEDETDDDQA